jgi:hypothetical protein
LGKVNAKADDEMAHATTGAYAGCGAPTEGEAGKQAPMSSEPVWDLYIYPGGKAGESRTRLGAWLWALRNLFSVYEYRAIERETGEHIIL